MTVNPASDAFELNDSFEREELKKFVKAFQIEKRQLHAKQIEQGNQIIDYKRLIWVLKNDL